MSEAIGIIFVTVIIIAALMGSIFGFTWMFARYEDSYCKENPSAFNCVLQMEKAKNAVLTQGK